MKGRKAKISLYQKDGKNILFIDFVYNKIYLCSDGSELSSFGRAELQKNMLIYLADHPDQQINSNKEELYIALWGSAWGKSPNDIHGVIHRCRDKLHDLGQEEIISSVGSGTYIYNGTKAREWYIENNIPIKEVEDDSLEPVGTQTKQENDKEKQIQVDEDLPPICGGDGTTTAPTDSSVEGIGADGLEPAGEIPNEDESENRCNELRKKVEGLISDIEDDLRRMFESENKREIDRETLSLLSRALHLGQNIVDGEKEGYISEAEGKAYREAVDNLIYTIRKKISSNDNYIELKVDIIIQLMAAFAEFTRGATDMFFTMLHELLEQSIQAVRSAHHQAATEAEGKNATRKNNEIDKGYDTPPTDPFEYDKENESPTNNELAEEDDDKKPRILRRIQPID